jgi:hypothetical protein
MPNKQDLRSMGAAVAELETAPLVGAVSILALPGQESAIRAAVMPAAPTVGFDVPATL